VYGVCAQYDTQHDTLHMATVCAHKQQVLRSVVATAVLERLCSTTVMVALQRSWLLTALQCQIGAITSWFRKQ